jgi:hypothetical protein
MQLSDGHDRGAQINGARAAPPFSAALCLTSVGPSSCHVIFPSAFPLLPCVIHPPPLLVRVASPSSHHPLAHLATCPVPFHVSLSPEGEFISPVFSLHLMSSAMNRPPSSFSHLVTLPRPYNPAPPFHVMRLILRAGLHAYPSSYSVIPGGSARSLPYPEVLSWLGRSQSQEAVIEAVGGG